MASERSRLPSILPTCTQGVTPSNTALRSLTGLGCFTCSVTNRLIGPEYNRPTVFAVRPLLTGNNQLHYSRSRIMYRFWRSIILTPAHGHSVLRDPHTRALLLPSFLILSAPGCREAIPDFTNPPFLPDELPHLTFSGRVGYSPRQGSETTTRPFLRAPMGKRLTTFCG